MISISTKSYILALAFSWIIILYSLLNLAKLAKYNKQTTLLIVFLSFFLDSLIGDYSYFLSIFILYFALNKQHKINLKLINIIVISFLINLIVGIITTPVLSLNLFNEINNFGLVFIKFLLELLITIISVKFLKKMNIDESFTTTFLLVYLFLIIYLFMSFIQHFSAYIPLISGILLFILIQLIIVTFILVLDRKSQNKKYNEKIIKDQLDNLRVYTEHLDIEQKKVRKFKHDYKNIITSLDSIAHMENNQRLLDSLSELTDYSNEYFNSSFMSLFKDLEYVSNPYIKSLLISKLRLIQAKDINIHFECKYDINNVNIGIFDLIRLIGIAIDNAIEETENQPDGKIQIIMINESTQLTFNVNNTIKNNSDLSKITAEGFTTKEKHSGLGLVNVTEIKRKYPNLFTLYDKDEGWFHFQITITN